MKLKEDRLLRELDSVKKLTKERDDDFRKRLDGLERRNRELESDNQRNLAERHALTLKEKGAGEREQVSKQVEKDYVTAQTELKNLQK